MKRSQAPRRTGGRSASSSNGAARSGPSVPCARQPSFVADPRVDHRVEQVDQEVGEHEDRRDHQDRALHHRVVAIEDALDQHAAQALDREHVLDHDRAGHQQRERDAHHGHHRDQGVGEGVDEDQARLQQPLGAGDLHVLGLQHLEHRGADHARHDRGERRADRDRGQDQVREPGPEALGRAAHSRSPAAIADWRRTG